MSKVKNKCFSIPIDDFRPKAQSSAKTLKASEFKAISHAVVMGKFFEDYKTSKQAALIDSCFYNTNK